MIEIDGSQGEGGGQILRSSLTLAMVTGQPVRLTRIRAGRKKPGLMRAHLAAVLAASEVCRARVDGAAIGSRELTFRPGAVSGGDFSFRIGTAGSTSLVLQTVLPALLCAGASSTLLVEGGTHNPMAPPFEFLQRTYLPLLSQLGPRVDARLIRPGFFPVGKGQIEVTVSSSPALNALTLTERGELIGRRVQALVSLLNENIGRRECCTLTGELGWSEEIASTLQVRDAAGPGNALVCEMQFEHLTEVLVEFGEPGKRAERVAMQLVRQIRRYLKADVPVGQYLADQLLLPLAIGASQGTGGGVIRTLSLTRHSRTHIEVIRRFLNADITVTEAAPDDVLVEVQGG
jgi:RNA 3'-terminal phosphate cyclase (ATP)